MERKQLSSDKGHNDLAFTYSLAGLKPAPNRGHKTRSSRFHCQQKRGISGDYTLQKTTNICLKMVILLWAGVLSLLRSFIFSERRTKCYTRRTTKNNFLRLWNFAKRQTSGSNSGNPPGWRQFLSLQSSQGFMKSSKKQI